MILNPFALISLFVGAISVLLMASASLSALYFGRRYRRCDSVDGRATAEARIHLSLLLLFTAFLIRLATWPLFYILLQSLIPLVPGAMCIYGVTQAMPLFIAFLQVLKPLAFFLTGGWLLFYALDLSLKNRPLMDRSVRLLAVVAAVAIADGLAEILFLFFFAPPGAAVSCCTVVADIVIPSTPLLPAPLFSTHNTNALLAGYHAFNLGLAGLMAYLVWKKNTRRAWLRFVALAALVNGLASYGAFKEYLGPQLMHLPDHHCLYCLLQYQPVSIAILGLFIAGSFFAIWPVFLSCFAAVEAAKERLAELNLNLLKWAAACLLASWILTTAGILFLK